MFSHTVFLTLVCLCGFVVASEGCMCMPAHPQTAFCKADFGKCLFT